jgi:proline iminopeptidase
VGGAALEVFKTEAGRPLICSTHQYIAYQDLVRSNRTAPLLAALAEVGRLVFVDPRGVGNSSPATDAEHLTMERLVDDLEQVRLRLGGERWVFVGATIGGMIGLQYALRYPHALAGLIVSGAAPSWRFVEDPSCIYHPHHPQRAAFAAAAAARQKEGASPEERRRWRDLVIELSVHRTENLRRFLSDPADEAVMARLQAFQEEIGSHTYDVSDRLREIVTPTLVLHGRHDPQVPVSQGLLLHQGIRSSEYVVFEESGHFPYAEETERFRAVVRRFVERSRWARQQESE